MKYLCALLALLVLTLSVQPVCASISSSETCCSESTCNESQQSDENNPDKKECSNACNPFQVCGCCAFSVVPQIPPTFTIVTHTNFIPGNWAFFTCPFIEEPVLGFWQPPKLS
ncbi:MAG: hypothetical protein WC716_09790 [Chitinophagaceae bacterium]